MFDLTGKRALITGATGGIGVAIASALHSQGAAVVLSGTRLANLSDLSNSLGDDAHAISCDLSDFVSQDSLVDGAIEKMGGIDILVNNAGINRDSLTLRMKDEDWQSVLDINLTSAFRLSRRSVREMAKQRWGRVISIASIVGQTGNSGQSNYAASKAGLVGMTKSLALEMSTRGITANCIAPGFIDTDMTRKLSDQVRNQLMSRIATQSFGTPEDVAACVVFLASEEASYITGQTLNVNGGMAMI